MSAGDVDRAEEFDMTEGTLEGVGIVSEAEDCNWADWLTGDGTMGGCSGELPSELGGWVE